MEQDAGIHVSQWRLVITRNMSFWHQWMSTQGHFHHSKNFGIPVQIRQLTITAHGTQTSVFLQPDNVTQYETAVLESLRAPAGIVEIKQHYQTFAEELLVALDQLLRNLTPENWDAFIALYTRFCAGLFLTSTIGRAGMTALTELLQASGKHDADIPNTIGGITYPEEHTPLFQSRLDLLEIGAKVQSGASENEQHARLTEWLERFGPIPVNFCEDPWTIGDAEEQLKPLLQKNCKDELTRFQKEHQERVAQKHATLSEIGSEEISTLAQAIAEGTTLNEFRKNVFSRVSLGVRDLFQKAVERGQSANWRDGFYLQPDEMRSLLFGETLNVPHLVQERALVGFYTDPRGTNQWIADSDLKEFSAQIEATHHAAGFAGREAEKTIRGFSANRGIVTGIVRIIHSSKDFHKIQTGDILVTPMTSVDFVPIMEKAGAFVTNEGGITSHASIVAREMNKPCIIGTKIATQVLKDGDRVEVDANHGVVRIISHHPSTP